MVGRKSGLAVFSRNTSCTMSIDDRTTTDQARSCSILEMMEGETHGKSMGIALTISVKQRRNLVALSE